MTLHYAGKYKGDESELPAKEHQPNAVPFKEPENIGRLSVIANVGCLILMLMMAIPFYILGRQYIPAGANRMSIAGMCGVLSLLPHELLHALCFREDVYLYNALSRGLLFVVGTEDMSKGRFIFMCLCPNILLGVIPYVSFLIFPELVGLGLFGIICTGAGFGDYINVYNAARQMPKGAKTYICGMHSYWYL